VELPFAEPWRIKSIETIRRSRPDEREAWIREARHNLFNLRSEQVYIDLLTDSGTGAMSAEQWSEIMLGDESYAGASSYYKLKESIEEILGFPHFLPTHQGRAAENVLFSSLIGTGNEGQGMIVPGNSHFDTTKGHIEFRHAEALDLTIAEAFDTESEHPFKGNVDLERLEAFFKATPRQRIPLFMLTITCNSSGGQPVSMENIRGVSALCKRFGVPLFIDSARFAENAYFIKVREEGYGGKGIREIVREMFAFADGATMSSKKDGIVNIGGFVAFRAREDFERAMTFNIMYEGFNTYGGMAGRDLGALSVGLREATTFEYLEARIGQVGRLGASLIAGGIPIQKPCGGHAIYLNALRFLEAVPRGEYVAQTLAVELYREGGVRGVEIGAIMADRDPVTRADRFPALELVRLAIPRRVYTDLHMEYVAAVVGAVWERRKAVTRGYRITREASILRHFTVELEALG
jgi:tryptophanase